MITYSSILPNKSDNKDIFVDTYKLNELPPQETRANNYKNPPKEKGKTPENKSPKSSTLKKENEPQKKPIIASTEITKEEKEQSELKLKKPQQ